jgi:lipid II:glycine glycyltransferase (peptidoglycan interpeptide bridge formation enzyme)
MNSYTAREVPLISWNDTMLQFRDGHFLLSEEWAAIKAAGGWQAMPFVWEDEKKRLAACALVLHKRIRIARVNLPIAILYAPKGPLLDWEDGDLVNQVLSDLETLAHKKKAIFIKIDPDVELGRIAAQEEDLEINPQGKRIEAILQKRTWQFSSDQIQFRNTVWIDLSKSEDQILAGMKQKTRYNIRLAAKKGVIIRSAELSELPLLYKLYAQTALRDGFTIRDEQYYLMVWEKFISTGLCEVLLAEFEGEVTAGLVLFYFGEKAYYVYGMSTNAHRNTMSTYLIQWEAILRAKNKGKMVYDLWGAPEELSKDDPLWGVYRFKRGLGGEFISTLGAWDYVARPIGMKLYSVLIPWFLDILRKISAKKIDH